MAISDGFRRSFEQTCEMAAAPAATPEESRVWYIVPTNRVQVKRKVQSLAVGRKLAGRERRLGTDDYAFYVEVQGTTANVDGFAADLRKGQAEGRWSAQVMSLADLPDDAFIERTFAGSVAIQRTRAPGEDENAEGGSRVGGEYSSGNPPPGSALSPVESLPSRASTFALVLAVQAERDAAQRERDLALRERDNAQVAMQAALQAAAQREREAAQRERDAAQREREVAAAATDVARRERDAAQREREVAAAAADTERQRLISQLLIDGVITPEQAQALGRK